MNQRARRLMKWQAKKAKQFKAWSFTIFMVSGSVAVAIIIYILMEWNK